MDDKINQLVIGLLRAGAFLQREGNRITAPFGLHQQQFVVLNFITNREPLSPHQICSGLLYEKSNVSKIIKKLEKMELIKISNSATDKRVNIIESTKDGKKVVAKVNQHFNEFNQQLLNGYSDKEVNETLIFMNKLKFK